MYMYELELDKKVSIQTFLQLFMVERCTVTTCLKMWIFLYRIQFKSALWSAIQTPHIYIMQAYSKLSMFEHILRLSTHDGKVRILNFNSKCAFWITQCTHDRSTCVFWITHYTHEWPKMWFSFRERGEEAWLCLGCLPIKHARVLFTFPLHVQRAVL